MKITDDEREAAYELRYLIEGILIERERAVLYREVYAEMVRRGCGPEERRRVAQQAVSDMETAFGPLCEACEEENRNASQTKAN